MIRKQLAWACARPIYRKYLISDLPRNGVFFFLCYGNLYRLYNCIRVFIQYKQKRLTIKGYPYSIRADVTNVCNLRCPLCPTGTNELGRKPGMLTMDTFLMILEEFERSAFRFRFDLWGEPLLNKNLTDMIAAAEDKHVATEISTNLSIQLNDDQIDGIIKAGLTWLIVSCDGASSDVYKEYRRGGDFALVMHNLKRFIERRKKLNSVTPIVEWQFVPFRHNEHEISRAARLAEEIGVDGFRIKPPRLDKIQNDDYSMNVSEDIEKQWAPLKDYRNKKTKEEKASLHNMLCPYLWRSVTVNYDGMVAPCCETTDTKQDLGKLRKGNFLSIWNGDNYKRARRVAQGIVESNEDKEIACHQCKVFTYAGSAKEQLTLEDKINIPSTHEVTLEKLMLKDRVELRDD